MANALHEPAAADGQASMTGLLTGIFADAQRLIEQQFAMFKAELRSDFAKTKQATMMLAAGAAVGVIGVVLIAFTAVYALNELAHLQLWASYAIVAAVLTVGGGAAIYAGILKFQSFNPLPDETAAAIRENVGWTTTPTTPAIAKPR